jgi:hypothetical protein
VPWIKGVRILLFIFYKESSKSVPVFLDYQSYERIDCADCKSVDKLFYE